VQKKQKYTVQNCAVIKQPNITSYKYSRQHAALEKLSEFTFESSDAICVF